MWSGSRPFWSCVQRRRANNLEAEIGPGEDALRLAQTFNLGRDGVLANVEVLHQEVAALVELGLVGRELLRVVKGSGQITLRADLDVGTNVFLFPISSLPFGLLREERRGKRIGKRRR